MPKRREGPLKSRMSVTSEITVTYVSPYRVWRHMYSSTPTARTPSNRAGSLFSRRIPSDGTTVLAEFRDTPRHWAMHSAIK